MIKLADGRGHLYQWDTGRQVECDAEQVHFSNHHYGTSIDVDAKDGKAMIPNQLLTSAMPLKAWAWVKDSSGEYTKEEQIFLVAKRNKPSDYVYTPTEIKTWQDLQNQIGDLNNLTTAHKDNLVNAINDATESGAGDFIIRMTVEANGDDYTVTACDKTMEQIDAAGTSGQNIKAIAFDKYIMPLIQMQYSELYTFGAFLGSFLVAANVAKNPESGTDDWQFYLEPIVADIVSYSNAALPNVDNVQQALDELVPKSHTHSNKDTLDKLSDSNGKLQYNGSDISVTKNGVINALGYTPQAVSTKVTTGTSITLADNTEYRLADVTTLTLTYPIGDFECWLRLSFATSGTITVTLPADTKYIGTAPDFKNGETWELSFKDKVLAAQKVGEGT